MIIKYGKELKWEDIKIGQAFYFIGCHGFGIKEDVEYFIVLDYTTHPQRIKSKKTFTKLNNALLINVDESGGGTAMYPWFLKYYDLPKSIKECLEEKK